MKNKTEPPAVEHVRLMQRLYELDSEMLQKIRAAHSGGDGVAAERIAATLFHMLAGLQAYTSWAVPESVRLCGLLSAPDELVDVVSYIGEQITERRRGVVDLKDMLAEVRQRDSGEG